MYKHAHMLSLRYSYIPHARAKYSSMILIPIESPEC